MVLKWTSILLLIGLLACQEPTNNSTYVEEEESTNETLRSVGESIFLKNCTSCHGEDGKLGNSGAKDLTLSTMKDDEMRSILEDGKNAMPAMGILMEKPGDLDSVIAYVKKFRK